jgi:hypothetical protein
MNPYDEFNKIQALQKQLDPLRHIPGSHSLNSVEENYRRILSISQLGGSELKRSSDLDKYREQAQEMGRWYTSLTGVPSAAERALAIFEQPKLIFSSLNYLRATDDAQKIFDTYQRATAWLDPIRALTPAHDWLNELEKYRSLTAVADPLGLYRRMTEQLYGSSTWGITQQVQDMLDALESVARDIDSVASDTDRADQQIDEDDVARVSGLVDTSRDTVSFSPDSILQFVHAWMSAYEQLASVQDKKIFATYIYPVIVALVFSLINPYFDFVVKQRLEAANKSSEKAVKSAARESGIPTHVIENFRFVSAQRLDVRRNGKMRSPTVGFLSFGQPVEILKKDGDWTLVHYSDSESDTAIQGWVLSRYLKRYR